MLKFLFKLIEKIKKIYNSISNKLLAFIILAFIIWFLYFYTIENFINNNWNIIINSNINNYNVKLYKNIFKNLEKEKFCDKKICEINNVIPSKYKFIITKKWYKDIIKNFELNKKTDLKININLVKKISLKKENIKTKINLTRKEKINQLNAKLQNQQILKIGDNLYIKEKKIRNNIFIFINDKEIINFKNTNKEIFFDKIFQEENEIFIFSWEKIYFFDLITKKLISFNFKLKPIYIKKLNNSYLIITEKWAFIYDVNIKKVDYFYLFKDFIKYKNNLIWIIFQSEKNKKKNLWIKDKSNNLILKYNPKTKERKIIYKTLKKPWKIFVKNKKIYIILKWEIFLLEWID
jgi:hypothetical protein